MSFALPSDERLMGDAPVHARESVQDIVRAHATYVGRSLRYLGVPEADLEDAAQEVFLVVHRRYSDFEGRSSVRTWLYGICVRVASSTRRRAAARPEPVGELPEPQTADGDQLAALERGEARARLLRVLDTLDDEQRAAFVLFEIECQSMKEVAAALGCPLQTAYYRHQAARRRVLEAFAPSEAKETE